MTNNWSSESEKVFLLHCLELLAMIFRGPDAETCEGMISQGLPSLVADCPSAAGNIQEPLMGMQAALSGAGETACDTVAVEYVRLFVNSAGGTLIPLYESCHTGDSRRMMGPAALAMRERFAAAGVEPVGNEPPDHLPLEIEYLYLLLTRAWDDAVPGDVADASAFAEQGMLPWCRALYGELSDKAPDSFFRMSSALLIAVLDEVASLQ